jgi:hypothetical protein
MKHTFRPEWELVALLQGRVETVTIAEEPMLFSASPAFAESYGGPLTRAVLRSLEKERHRWTEYIASHPGTHAVIDTRSHMLMPGQYPAIPGWHCDAYPRGKGGSGQPDLEAGDPECFHYVVTVSDQQRGVSNTAFLEGTVTVEVDPEQVWGSVHDEIRELAGVKIPDGNLIRFKQESLHRASATHAKGWRWFFRLSMYHSAPMNQIRRQVQVYSTEGGGW